MDQEKTIEEVIQILEMQEEILQFKHFTNNDAWELGSLLVREAKQRNLAVAISIRLNNGYVVFQYGCEGTNYHNELWIKRKANTVRVTEKSSLRLYTQLKQDEQSMQDLFLDEKEYACGGGGFPIRVEEVGVVASIIVSGLNHVADHDFLVKCLGKYLHADEVPRIREGNYK